MKLDASILENAEIPREQRDAMRVLISGTVTNDCIGKFISHMKNIEEAENDPAKAREVVKSLLDALKTLILAHVTVFPEGGKQATECFAMVGDHFGVHAIMMSRDEMPEELLKRMESLGTQVH